MNLSNGQVKNRCQLDTFKTACMLCLLHGMPDWVFTELPKAVRDNCLHTLLIGAIALLFWETAGTDFALSQAFL